VLAPADDLATLLERGGGYRSPEALMEVNMDGWVDKNLSHEGTSKTQKWNIKENPVKKYLSITEATEMLSLRYSVGHFWDSGGH